MKKIIPAIFLLSLSLSVYCQQEKSNIVGRYGYAYSTSPVLIFYSDSTFKLEREEYNSYPPAVKSFTSTGVWTQAGKVITLNPGKEQRNCQVKFVEKEIEGKDSITIKVNCLREEYENEVLVRIVPFAVDRMTLYINKAYVSLVHAPIRRICAYAPKIKHQVVLDSLNGIKISKQKIDRLAINTYGLNEKVELSLTNPNANYYEITIVQPVDTDRKPRGEMLWLDGKYLYDYDGRHRPSLLWADANFIKLK